MSHDHYVQKAYLKRFLRKREQQLLVYEKKKGSYDCVPHNPDKVFEKSNYYPKGLETKILGECLEPKGLKGFDKIILGSATEEDIAFAYTYIEIQYYGVPKNSSDFLDQIWLRLSPNKETYEKGSKRSLYPVGLLYENIGMLTNMLLQCNCFIYSIPEDEDHSFITSDNPTCLPGFHPLHFDSCISNNVFFPVDRNHALRFIPSNERCKPLLISSSKEEIMWINALTVDNAHEKIVGRSKKDINEALKYFTSKNI